MWFCKHAQDTHYNFLKGENGVPGVGVVQDVEADLTRAVDVRMVNLCLKQHQRVILWDAKAELELAFFVRRARWSLNDGDPLEGVVSIWILAKVMNHPWVAVGKLFLIEVLSERLDFSAESVEGVDCHGVSLIS